MQCTEPTGNGVVHNGIVIVVTQIALLPVHLAAAGAAAAAAAVASSIDSTAAQMQLGAMI
mgnify:CR=1 FL=1